MNILKKVISCMMIGTLMASLVACEDIESETEKEDVVSAVVEADSNEEKDADVSDDENEQKDNKNEDDITEKEESEEDDTEKTVTEEQEKDTKKIQSPEMMLRLEYVDKVAGIIDESEDGIDLTVAERLEQSRNEFQAFDLILNEVYNYHKKNMAFDEFKKLEADEIEWIKKKEAAMVEESEGLDGDDKENKRLSTAASYTQDRCYYLIMLIGNDETGKRKEFYEDMQHVYDGMEPLSPMANQSQMNHYSAERYENIKGFYDKVYEYHRRNMNSDEYTEFETEESRWKKERESTIDKELKHWEGGSMAPLIANGLGTALTNERCYYLIALID